MAAPALADAVPPQAAQAARAEPRSFRDIVDLFEAKREGVLHGLLWNSVHLLRFEPGLIEIRAPGCPRDFASRLMDMLGRWTGRRWVVSLSDQPQGEPTLAQQQVAAVAARKAKAAEHPLVRSVLELFPGATLEAVRGPDSAEPASPPPPPEEGIGDGIAPPHESDVIPDTIDLEYEEP